MKKIEKLKILRQKHFEEFTIERERIYNELSDNQPMFCCCGKLATGLHERYCKKFNNKVDSKLILYFETKYSKSNYNE